MFDKLIVSEPEGADFKNRRGYFMVSSLVVGVLFLTAVVFSIFAADYGLGRGDFDLVELVMPPEMAAAIEPEPQPQPNQQTASELPTRQADIERLDQSTLVPKTTSVVPNTQQERPLGRYRIDGFDSNPVGGSTVGGNREGTAGGPIGLSYTSPPAVEKEETAPPPLKEPVRKPVTKHIGVVNSKATYLPKPPYPAVAVAAGVRGKVDVQIVIDETGKVIAANAVSGHAFLRGPAERAAWNARFTPTRLSDVPIKVTGVIVYNFTR